MRQMFSSGCSRKIGGQVSGKTDKPSGASRRWLRIGAALPIVTVACGIELSALRVLAADAPNQHDSGPRAPLTVRISNLRSDKGRVGCALYDGPKGFPKDSTAALQRQWSPIANRAATTRFESLTAGTYAVACFHDENSNGKLDRGVFGIPSEGTVASNQAKGFMGAPKFDAAKFKFNGSPSQITLKMEY